MKYILTSACVLSMLFPSALPVQAGSIEDLVRVNCTRWIMHSDNGVDSNQVKTFHINRQGGGWVMSGRNESNQTVTCEAADDGHVTWIKVS
jgi:hypothetical protein